MNPSETIERARRITDLREKVTVWQLLSIVTFCGGVVVGLLFSGLVFADMIVFDVPAGETEYECDPLLGHEMVEMRGLILETEQALQEQDDD